MVESKKYSEMLKDAIKRYHNRMIDTVITQAKMLAEDLIKNVDKKDD